MRPAVVESILARCLLESDFLARLQRQPLEALEGYDIPPGKRSELASAAWHRVKSFSGFIGKVQHNYLWELFPCTRRLLTHYGIEHRLFADYRGTQLSPTISGADRPARIRAFLDFAATWIGADRDRRRACRPLLEVMQHERATWDVGTQPKLPRLCPFEDFSRLSWAGMQRLVIGPVGIVHIRTFEINPLQIQRAVESRDFNRLGRPRTPIRLAYWRSLTSPRVRIAEIDAVSAVVLRHVDGVRSIRRVITATRRTVNTRPHDFRPLIETIVRLGIVMPYREA